MALAFCETDKDVSRTLYVNHKNGIRGNDFVDNLEWVTPRENVEHAGALGLTKKCVPVMVRNIDTGDIMRYNSATSAARSLGMSKDAVLYRLRFGGLRIFPERRQYATTCIPDWNNPVDIKDQLLLNGRSQSIDVRNVVTGEEFRFGSMTAAAESLGVKFSTMAAWSKRTGQPVLPGNIQVKIPTREKAWRPVIDLRIERARASNTRPVEVISLQGDRFVYDSALQCATAFGLKPTALDYRLKTNGSVVFNGHRYGYYPLNLQLSITSPTSQ
jgi:hypothetical protein